MLRSQLYITENATVNNVPIPSTLHVFHAEEKDKFTIVQLDRNKGVKNAKESDTKINVTVAKAMDTIIKIFSSTLLSILIHTIVAF